MKKHLEQVTLIGVDCIDIERLRLAANISQEGIGFADVRLLTSLEVKGKDIVPIQPISSLEEYSLFVLSKLNYHIHSTHILLIQHDGFILNHEAWNDDFLGYDYIGAPWIIDPSFLEYGFSEGTIGERIVGNGGFSLRSKRLLALCAKLAKESTFSRHHPEDVSICYWHRDLLESEGIRFAPAEIADQFSLEGGQEPWNDQLGFHDLSRTDLTRWLARHPQFFLDSGSNSIQECTNYQRGNPWPGHNVTN